MPSIMIAWHIDYCISRDHSSAREAACISSVQFSSVELRLEHLLERETLRWGNRDTACPFGRQYANTHEMEGGWLAGW
jgi:hypothetical protein